MKLRGAKLKQVEQERLECVLQSAVVSAHPGVERLRFPSACGDNALAVLLLSQWRDRGCVVGERERETLQPGNKERGDCEFGETDRVRKFN